MNVPYPVIFRTPLKGNLLAAAPASEEAYISFDPKRGKGFNPNTRLLAGQVYETRFYLHEKPKNVVSKASLAGNTTKECLLLHRKIPDLTDEPDEPKQGDT